MSWDAYLTCECCTQTLFSANYTHNCNGMANAVLDPDYTQRGVGEEVFRFQDRDHVSWWKRLDGLSGPDGAQLLDVIVRGLEADPERFQAMNPPNGWGDYDTFLTLLRKMRDEVPEFPTRWVVHG